MFLTENATVLFSRLLLQEAALPEAVIQMPILLLAGLWPRRVTARPQKLYTSRSSEGL